MRKVFYKVFVITILSLLFFQGKPVYSKSNGSFFIVTPSFSKHLKKSYLDYREFHPGIGIEFQWKSNLWVLGCHAYYMNKDSLDHESYWTGLTVGIELGNFKKFWIAPFVLVGGIKKEEYNSGKFSLFALPVISAGYNRLGINLGFIPRIPNITDPLFILQFKIRI